MIIKFLTLEQVSEIHDIFLQKYNGLPGIRDRELLASAVETPKASMFGKDLHQTVYEKAAAYLFHLVKNHPFNDGNKRTAAGAALMFLRVNSIDPRYDNAAYVELVVDTAAGKIDKPKISQFFEACSDALIMQK